MATDATCILITGGASGLGLATARVFASRGTSVVVVDRRPDAMRQASVELEDLGGRVVCIEADVSTDDGAQRCVNEALREFGRVDVLFSNAGIDPPTSTTLLETPEADWDRIMAVNVKATYLLVRRVLPHMLLTQQGVVIATSSIAGVKALPAEAAYCISKAALIHLVRCLARDYAHAGIRANCVCPGFLERSPHDRQAPISPEERRHRARWAAELVPMGRFGTYDEVAQAVAFLASPEAAYINGSALLIDGAWSVA